MTDTFTAMYEFFTTPGGMILLAVLLLGLFLERATR